VLIGYPEVYSIYTKEKDKKIAAKAAIFGWAKLIRVR
jgi:hypothetical protein